MNEAHQHEVASWLTSVGLAGPQLVEALPAHQSNACRSSHWRTAAGEEVWVEDALTHPIGGFDAMPAPLDLRDEAAALMSACRALGDLALPGLLPWRDLQVDGDRGLIAFVRPPAEPARPAEPRGAGELGLLLRPLAEAIDCAAEVLPHGLFVSASSLALGPEGFLVASDWGLESFRRFRLSQDPETKLYGGDEMAARFAGVRAGKRPLGLDGPAPAATRAFVRLWIELRSGARALFQEDLERLPPGEAALLRDALAAPAGSLQLTTLLHRLASPQSEPPASSALPRRGRASYPRPVNALARLEAIGFLKRKSRRAYRRTAPAEEIRNDLAALHAWANAAVKRETLYRRLRVASAVLGLVAGGVIAANGDAGGLIFGGVLAAVLWTVFGVVLFFTNPPDRRRIGLTRMLLHELAIPEGAPVELTLDLGSPTASWKRAGKEHGMKTWRDLWLELSAPLEGGGRVRIQRTQTFGEVVQHEVHKSITHTRVQHLDGLELHAGPSQALQAPPDLRTVVPQGVAVTGFQGDARGVRVELASGRNWSTGSGVSGGLLDVFDVYERLLVTLIRAAGLPSVFRQEGLPWTVLRAPAFRVSSFLRALGVLGLLASIGFGLVFVEDVQRHYRERDRIDAGVSVYEPAPGEDPYAHMFNEFPNPAPLAGVLAAGAALLFAARALRKRGS